MPGLTITSSSTIGGLVTMVTPSQYIASNEDKIEEAVEVPDVEEFKGTLPQSTESALEVPER